MTTRRNRHDTPQEHHPVEYRGTGFYVSVVLILLIAVILLIVAVQNTAQVAVRFLAWELELPLFAIIVGTGLVTVLMDEMIGLVWRRQRRNRLSERAELERLRSERRAEADEPGTPDDVTNTEPLHEPGLTAPVGSNRPDGGASPRDR